MARAFRFDTSTDLAKLRQAFHPASPEISLGLAGNVSILSGALIVLIGMPVHW
jgi:hypothetical protein